MTNKNIWLKYFVCNIKRGILFSVLLYGLNAGAFALDLSAGGGAAMVFYDEGLSVSAPGYHTANIEYAWKDWGIFAFFDAEFLEVDVGYFHAFAGSYEQSDFGYPYDLKSTYKDIKVSYLDMGLLLKLPVKSKNKKTIFAFTGGLSYWINLQADYGYTSEQTDVEKPDWNQLWFDLGCSFDQYVSEKIYLRFTAGLSIPMETKGWKERMDELQKSLGREISGVETKYSGIGAKLTIAVGYKLNGEETN
jgi:hypothetical protein